MDPQTLFFIFISFKQVLKETIYQVDEMEVFETRVSSMMRLALKGYLLVYCSCIFNTEGFK